MRRFELSPRLQALADLVPQGARFADVGTDHAYLPVWLILQGTLDSAVVSDLREGPLERARQTAEHYGVAEQMSFRLCDGLAGVAPEEAHVIAIAGMGGETIASILSAAPWTATENRRLLLQPMSGQEELRAWLYRHSYSISQELLVCEGKTIYSIFVASGGVDIPLTPAEIWAGRQHKGDCAPLRSLYLAKVLRRVESALVGLRRSERAEDLARRVELEQVAHGLSVMKEEWDKWQP